MFRILLLLFITWDVGPLILQLKLTAASTSEIKETSPLEVLFKRDVLPALQVNCLPCHNQTRARAGLNLETPATMIQGGDSGTALVPGHPNQSPLFITAAHLDPDRIMPPPDNKSNARALTSTELDLLKSWIEQGAPSDLSSEDIIQWQPIAESWNSSFAIAFSNDGREIAIGRANRVHIYNVETGQCIATLLDPLIGSAAQSDIVGALSFSPDDSLLAVGGFREVRLWRRQPVQIEPAWAHNPPTAWKRAVVSADKKHIALWTQEETMEIRRLKDGELLGTWPSTASSPADLPNPTTASTIRSNDSDTPETSAILPTLAPKDPRIQRSIVNAEHEITLSQLEQDHADGRIKELEAAIQSATEKRAASHTKRDTDAKALASLESELEAQHAIETNALSELETIESTAQAIPQSNEKDTNKSEESNEVAGPDPEARKKEIEERIAAVKKAISDLSPRISKARISFEGSSLDVELTEAALMKATTEMEQSVLSKSAANERIVLAQAQLANLLETLSQTESLPILLTAIEPDNKARMTLRADGLAFRSDSASSLPTLAFELGSSPILALIAYDSHDYLVVRPDHALRIKTSPRWELERSIGNAFATSNAASVSGSTSTSTSLVDRVNALTFSPEGQWLATAGGQPSRSGELRVWNVVTGNLVKDFSDRHSDSIMAVAFSARGDWIATGGADRFGRITPMESASGSMTDLEGHTHHVLAVAVLADNSVLATAGADTRIKLWNPRTGQRIKDVDGFGKEVTGIQTIGLSRNFVAVSGSGTGRVISADGTKIRDLAPVPAFLQTLAVSRDGLLAAAGADDGQLRIWNLASGELIQPTK